MRKEREKSPHNEIKHVLFNNKSEINITSKNFNNNRNIRSDLYNIYKGNTNNTNSGDYYSRNETTFNDSINVNKKYFETTNNASERYNNPNNIFLNGKNNYDNSHHRKTPSNNVLKNCIMILGCVIFSNFFLINLSLNIIFFSSFLFIDSIPLLF